MKEPISIDKVITLLTIINAWIFGLYIINTEFAYILKKIFDNFEVSYLYIKDYLMIIFTYGYALGIKKLSLITMTEKNLFSIILYSIGILFTISLNTMGLANQSISNLPIIIGILISLSTTIMMIISLFALYDLLKSIVLNGDISIEWIPVSLLLYSMIYSTYHLVTFYNLGVNSFILSIIYLVVAFLSIFYGFRKRYSSIRRVGLILSLLSIIKLFLIDLNIITSGYKIASYFSFGIILLAISFIYQYFDKLLSNKVIE